MTKKVNIESIEKATERPWKEWVMQIEAHNGKTMDHTELARLTRELLNDPTWVGKAKDQNLNWWAQNIAVAYEQFSGKREPGRQSDGLFAGGASRTIEGQVRDIFDKWCGLSRDLETHDFRTAETPKRLYWRTSADDQSKIELAFEQKTGNRVLVTAYQSKLASIEKIEECKQYWKNQLEKL